MEVKQNRGGAIYEEYLREKLEREPEEERESPIRMQRKVYRLPLTHKYVDPDYLLYSA